MVGIPTWVWMVSLAVAGQAGTDAKWAASLEQEAKMLPGEPLLTIDGSKLAGFRMPATDGADARARIVDVVDQPFGRALHVEVVRRSNPSYLIQVVSPPSHLPIEKGDRLVAVAHLRCLSSRAEDGGGHFAAYAQLPREPWTGFGGFSGSVGKAWTKRYANFVATEDRKPGELEIAFHLGQYEQVIEIGGLALFNVGKKADPTRLPYSRLSYAGQEPSAPWRKAALERIERHRKADLEIRVRDEAGKPLAAARVRVRMKRHAYQFGTFLEAPALEESPDGERYRETVRKLFNRVTVPMYWADWGWDYALERERYQKLAAWAHAENFAIRGHNLIWPDWRWCPSWLRSYEKDPERLRNIINASIAERVALYKRFELDDYDVINELRENRSIVDILGWDEPAKWFKLVRLLDPKPALGINEYSIISGGGATETEQATYEEHIRMLLGSGAPLGVIGVQCHMGEALTPPERIVAILDRFGAFGIPIHATEFDMNIDDEEAQARYMRDFMTAFFSHPATTAVTQWGFWEGQHWLPKAALFRKDWSLKPCGKAYMDLVLKEWWTNADGQTDAQGSYKVRGFLGSYVVEVEAGGKKASFDASLCRGGSLLNATLR